MNTIIFHGIENWDSKVMVSQFLDFIFHDHSFTDEVLKSIKNHNIEIPSLNHLVGFLRQIFRDNINWDQPDPNHDYIHKLNQLSTFEQNSTKFLKAYDTKDKDNPNSVFWPNPDKYKNQNLYETAPFSKHIPLIDKNTKLSSAGSCFAFEISRTLQKQGYNYLIKEKEHLPEEGVYADTIHEFPRFSANWGILFNTPSFSQLAEKAFHLKNFPKYLVKKQNGENKNEFFYLDPFRENVYFQSPEAYERNYPKHLEAIRNTFLEAEVFILTLGLNECWQLQNGLVLSRMPHDLALNTVLQPKVLSYEENLFHVQKFINIIREHNPKVKFIITVSPVPLLATFRSPDHHVISANGHSKAILRTVAEEIVRTNSDTFYFPSYEVVTSCSKDPWVGDQRHVNPEVVKKVMNLFEQSFVK